MSKGALPVPYIVAIIIAIIVIAVLVYWFFILSGRGTATASEQFCRAREFTYCSQWSTCGYTDTCKPKNILTGKYQNFCCGENDYAKECSSFEWASAVDSAECDSVLGRT